MNIITAEKIATEAALDAVYGIIETVINTLEGVGDERATIAREALTHAAEIAAKNPDFSTTLKDELFRTLRGKAENRGLHITQDDRLNYIVKDSTDRAISEPLMTLHQLEEWLNK